MGEPPTAGELVTEGEARLRRSPAIEHWPADRERREAEQLLSLVLGLDDEDPDPDAAVGSRERRQYRQLIRRRAGGEPLAHIFGYTTFCGLRLAVARTAFVPRQSSEFLVEQALRRLRGRRRPLAVDLATGVGPVALAVAHGLRRASVHGSDLSAEAIHLARRNAADLRLRNVTFHRGDLFRSLPSRLRGAIDVITIHPPYVPPEEVTDLPLEIRAWEPEMSLTDRSPHGLGLAERAAFESMEWLRPGGWLLMEVSPDRARSVRGLLLRAGYRDVRSTIGWPEVTRVLVGRA